MTEELDGCGGGNQERSSQSEPSLARRTARIFSTGDQLSPSFSVEMRAFKARGRPFGSASILRPQCGQIPASPDVALLTYFLYCSPHSRCLSALLPISLSTSLYTLFTADLCPLFFGALERLDSASGRDDFPTLIGLTYRRHKPETLRLPTQLVTISQPTDQRYISVYQLQLMSPVWKFLTSTKAVHEVSALRF